jgi:hypothetical protein
MLFEVVKMSYSIYKLFRWAAMKEEQMRFLIESILEIIFDDILESVIGALDRASGGLLGAAGLGATGVVIGMVAGLVVMGEYTWSTRGALQMSCLVGPLVGIAVGLIARPLMSKPDRGESAHRATGWVCLVGGFVTGLLYAILA